MRKEFIPGKLKPEYALMNKVIHNMIGPKGNEKLPNKEEIQFLYEVMNGKIIDYAMVIWCIILGSPTKNRNIPFQTLVTNLVEAVGIRGFGREKRVLPRLGPSYPPLAIFEASSSPDLGPLGTSPLKRMESRIKGWFKCIMGKKKQLDHRLSRLESHIYEESPL